MVLLHRRRVGAEGIYRCEIPDAMNISQAIYIGVYDTPGKPLPTHWYGHYIYIYNYVVTNLQSNLIVEI